MIQFQVPCPCGSGQVVAGEDEGFSATDCRVEACDACQVPGIKSRIMRKSWCYENMLPKAAGLQHVDGLVVFG